MAGITTIAQRQRQIRRIWVLLMVSDRDLHSHGIYFVDGGGSIVSKQESGLNFFRRLFPRLLWKKYESLPFNN
jgi:hypothetical protein